MRVDITECTPEGKPLSDCSCNELLGALNGILCYSMLRMHAEERLTNEVIVEVESRGYKIYNYNDTATEWEKSVGMKYAIAKGNEQLKDEDYHECIACELDWHWEYFYIWGPLTEDRKAKITARIDEARTEERKKMAEREAEEVKNPGATYCVTGMCLPLQKL